MTSCRRDDIIAGGMSYRVVKAATRPGEVIPHQEKRVETWTTCQTKKRPNYLSLRDS